MATDDREIGRKLRHIRQAKRKSLAVVAGLAGISISHLSRLETGQRALDRRSLIVALARALDVAPTDLTDLAVTTQDDLSADGTVDRVRHALLGVGMGRPGGQVQQLDGLRLRLVRLLDAQQHCRHDAVAQRLPALISDLHTTLLTGHDGAAVRSMAVLLHVQGTQAWLRDVGAPLDLGWQAAQLARLAAAELDDPTLRAVADFGTTHGLLAAGAFDLAARQLDGTLATTPTGSPTGLTVYGMLTLTRSLLAAASDSPAEVGPPLNQATELAERTGENNKLWFGFGPTNIGVWRMAVALESGDAHRAAEVAEQLRPELIPSPQRRAAYWANYGRALSRVRGRVGDAVDALRRAELISPARVRRHPFIRGVLSELLARNHRDSIGRELRRMAYRAGLFR